MKGFAKFVFAAGVAAMGPVAFATAYDWTLSSDDPDNVITNESHFTVPLASLTPADTMTIKIASDVTVRMPEGTYYGNLSPYFNVTAGHTLTYDGPGTWVQTNITSGSYIVGSKNHFAFMTESSGIFNYAVNETRGAYSFNNVKFRLRRAASGSETWFDLDRGTMNFYDPNGSGSSENLYTVNGSSSPITLAFHEGSTFRSVKLFVYGEHAKTYFIFDGGKNHYIYGFAPRGLNAGSDTSVDRTLLRVTGADTKLTTGTIEYANSVHHRWSVEVLSNATLVAQSGISQDSHAETDQFRVKDGMLTLGSSGLNKSTWTEPNLIASNLTFRGLATVTSFSGSGRVCATNSTFSTRALSVSGVSDFKMVGGSIAATGDSYFGSGTVACLDGGATATYGSSLYIADSGSAVVTLTNATFAATNSSAIVMLGNGSGSSGTLNVLDGATLTGAYRIILSGFGSATLNVGPGGTVNAVGGLYGYWNAASSQAVAFNQTGGLVTTPSVSMITGGSTVNCTAVYRLDGGEFRTGYLNGGASSAASSSYTSTAYLKGNGGTVVATAASTEFIRNMNGFLIGDKGLTVSSDYDITIVSSVGNDGDAAGRLVLTGSGVKTLSGTATTVSEIEIAEGTLKFASGARAASRLVVRGGAKVVFEEDPANIGLTGLSIGEETAAGVVTLASGQTIAVAGDVAITNLQLKLTGTYATDTTYTLLTATGDVSSETVATWVDTPVVSGAEASRSYVFSVDSGATPKAFKMAVSGYAYTLAQASGEGTDADDHAIGAMAVGCADVASGAKLTLSGKLTKGGFTKTGTGALYLTGLGSVFLRQICSQGGLFSVADMDALGTAGSAGFVLRADTFEYTGSGQTYSLPFVFNCTNNTSVVVLKNDGDLTLTDVQATSGAPLKRGVGKLTIAPASGTTVSLSPGNGSSSNYDPADYSGFSMPADGTAPTKGHLGFNILEGTVEIVGDATTTANIPQSIAVGMCNTDTVRAQPLLRIDGVKANLATASGRRVMIGCFTRSATEARYPRAEIVNGANVTCSSWMIGRNPGTSNWPTTVVDRATANFGALCAGWSTSSSPVYLFRNGAKVYSSSLTQYGPAYFNIEDTTWTTSGGGCFALEYHTTSLGSWNVGTNAVIACSKFTFGNEVKDSNRLYFHFNGGTWKTGDGANPTFHINRAEIVVFTTLCEGGLTLPVSASKTVDVARAIAGKGGVIKTGAGTLHFETQGTWDSSITTKTALTDPVSLAFTGTLDVREGAVTIDSTACRTGGAYKTATGTSIDFGGNDLGAATLAGGGSFANATVSGATLGLTLRDDGTLEGSPSLTDVTFDGNTFVDFGRTAAATPTNGLVVATFPNGAPGVEKWRARNLGRNSHAVFRIADNGNDVLADIAPRGFAVFLR